MMKMLKFMKLAEALAWLSEDLSTKVGAVALDANLNILSVGYNGLPRRVLAKAERLERPNKYLWTAHAEENLVANAAYAGHSLRGATVLVSTLYPCATCARLLIQAGVARIIAPPIAEGRWEEQNRVAEQMFNEAGVEVIYG